MNRRNDADLTGFVELLLPAQPSYVRLARDALRVIAARTGFTDPQANELAVAMSEAFTNVILHAKTTWVTIRFAVEHQRMTVEVEDDGQGFDTAILETPYTPSSEIGRGMHLIRSLMDAVECQSSPMGTLVRMTRSRIGQRREGQPWKVTARPFRTIAHVRRTIDRYRRDLALMQGQLDPIEGDLDDLAILERYAAADNKDSLISDRKLRIKTLEATLDILREDAADLS